MGRRSSANQFSTGMEALLNIAGAGAGAGAAGRGGLAAMLDLPGDLKDADIQKFTDTLFKQLDELYETDPAAYAKHLEQQAKAAGATNNGLQDAAAGNVPFAIMEASVLQGKGLQPGARVKIHTWPAKTGGSSLHRTHHLGTSQPLKPPVVVAQSTPSPQPPSPTWSPSLPVHRPGMDAASPWAKAGRQASELLGCPVQPATARSWRFT